MGFCIPRWTLADNEAVDFNLLQLGTFFTLIIQGITYYGVVDSSDVPTTTTIKCKLYSDAARTQEVISGVPTGVPYILNFFQGWKHDLLAPNDNAFKSNDLQIRVEDGIFQGYWRATPLEEVGEFDFDFIGTYQEFALVTKGVNAVNNGPGSLAAGTYTYCVVAIDSLGRNGAGSQGVSITVGTNESVLVTWTAVPGATQYKIYTSGGLLGTVNFPTLQFIDNGTIVPDSSMLPAVFPHPDLIAAPVPVDPGTPDPALQPDPSLGTPIISSTNITQESFIIDPNTGCIINAQLGDISVATDIGDFNIPSIISGVNSCIGIQVDPSLVDPNNLPAGAILVTVTITTVIDGNTITITEVNSASNEIKTLTIDSITGGYVLITTHPNGTTSTITGVFADVAELLLTLEEGAITTTTILDNFALDPNGIITANETIILNVIDQDPEFLTTEGAAIYIPDREGRLYRSLDGGLNFTLVNSNVLFSPPLTPLPLGTNSFAAGQGWFVQRAADTWESSSTPKFYITMDEGGTWTPINGAAFNIPAITNTLKMRQHNSVPMAYIVTPADGIVRVYPTLGTFVLDLFGFYNPFDVINNKFDTNLTVDFGDGYMYGLMQRSLDFLNVIVRRQLPATLTDPLGPVEEVYGPVPNETHIPGLRSTFLAIPGKMAYVYQKTDGNVYRATSTNGTSWNETNLGNAAIYASSGGPEETYFRPNHGDYYVEGVGIVAALANQVWVSSDLEIWSSVVFAGDPFDKFEILNHYAAPAADGSRYYFIDGDGNETVLDAGFNALKLEQPPTFMSAGDLAIQRPLRTGISAPPTVPRPPFNPAISIALPKVPLAPPPSPTSLPLSTRTRHRPITNKPSFTIGNRLSALEDRISESANKGRFYSTPFLAIRRAATVGETGLNTTPVLTPSGVGFL